MLIDSSRHALDETVQADVCVIGSGPAALALARSLAGSNRTVVMVERGGEIPRTQQRKVCFKSRRYDGIHNGIAFGFGGTSALWGGLLLPMIESELVALGEPWSEKSFMTELWAHYRTLESWLGVTDLPYDRDLFSGNNGAPIGLKWQPFTPLFSKWIPFRGRNLASAWSGVLQRTGKVRVLLHMLPSSWEFDGSEGDRTIRNVTCRAPDGQTTKVEAQHFVVAAGALDSPLILQDMLGKVRANELGVGRTLHDHLSLRIAEVTNFKRTVFEGLFSPFFNRTTMRSLRLFLPDQMDAQNASSNWAYCHFVVEVPEGSGYAVARDVLRGMQAKDYSKSIRALIRLPTAAADIIRMLYLRYAKQKLSISRGSRIFVNVDLVQTPSVDNKIFASSDADGETIEIDWDIRDDLKKQVDCALSALTSFWERNGLAVLGSIEPLKSDGNADDYLNNLYDIYHPAGTCAMGRVVDADLRIHGIKNGYVVGSSVFPKLGRSNPTLTIMALALRLAASIDAACQCGNQNNGQNKT